MDDVEVTSSGVLLQPICMKIVPVCAVCTGNTTTAGRDDLISLLYVPFVKGSS
jgi:hypothetical protein